MRISAETFREKIIELANRIKADDRAKKKLASLSEKELDTIQNNAMKLVPYYSENKSKTGGARRKTKRKRKNKNRTRKRRGGLSAPLALLILAGGVYFFGRMFPDFFTSDEELADRQDRQRYQSATRRLGRQRRRLRAQAWDEGVDAADYGHNPHGYFPAQEALTQFNRDRATARQRARGSWGQARDYTRSIGDVLPGGAAYEEARSRWDSGGGGGN